MSELGNLDREELVLGNYPTFAQEIRISGAASFRRGDVVVNSAGVIAPATAADAAPAGGGVPVLGIVCDDTDVPAGKTVAATMYVKGVFNRRALNFAAGTTADDLKDVMTALGMIVRETRV